MASPSGEQESGGKLTPITTVPHPERAVSSQSVTPNMSLRASSSQSNSAAPGQSPASGNSNLSDNTISSGHDKRTRRREDTTRVACQACREKRTKCNGLSPCERCQSKRIPCQYAGTKNKSKSELRQEIQTLQEKLFSSEKVINSFLRYTEAAQTRTHGARATSASSPAEQATTPPQSLHATLYQSPNNIGAESAVINHAQEQVSLMSLNDEVESQEDPMNWTWNESNYQLESTHTATDHYKAQILANETGSQLRTTGHASGERAERDSGQFLSAQQLSFGIQSAPGSWTTVTDDINLVHHLLALFFCWEHPIFVSLSREHFIRDFRNGRTDYCSTILVNAILAMGCRFSNQVVGRGNRHDPFSAGDLFFKEASLLLERELDQHSLPSIQALGLMSLRQISCGRQMEAQYLAGQAIRLAVEMGLHAPPEHESTPDELIVMSATFWGVYALDNIWSAIIPGLPHSSKNARLPKRFNLITAMDNLIWIPYVDEGVMAEHPCIQPAEIAAVFNCFSQLSEIVHRTSYQQQLTANNVKIDDIHQIYVSYLAWYDGAPEMAKVGKHSTPTVLFLHMYFQFAILTLLWPVVDVQNASFDLTPRQICWEAAIAIQKLTKTFSELYTLRRIPAFASHILTTALIALITMARSNVDNTVASTPISTKTMLESLPLAMRSAVENLAEIAMSQRGAQRELAKVQCLINCVG